MMNLIVNAFIEAFEFCISFVIHGFITIAFIVLGATIYTILMMKGLI